MGDTEDLSEIIKGCIRNERTSQEKLYRQFYMPLFSLCRRFFANDHEAIEAVNDGMLKVFRKIDSYKEDKGKFFTWVYTIVRNTAVDKFRTSIAIPPAGPLDIHHGLEETRIDANPATWLEGKDLYYLFDHLSPAPRAICGLFYGEGYTVREIADQLKISTGTVKWHLSESRKKLKPIVEKYINHD